MRAAADFLPGLADKWRYLDGGGASGTSSRPSLVTRTSFSPDAVVITSSRPGAETAAPFAEASGAWRTLIPPKCPGTNVAAGALSIGSAAARSAWGSLTAASSTGLLTTIPLSLCVSCRSGAVRGVSPPSACIHRKRTAMMIAPATTLATAFGGKEGVIGGRIVISSPLENGHEEFTHKFSQSAATSWRRRLTRIAWC